MPAEWAKISPSPLSWAPRIRPPIPDLQNTPDLSSFVTVFLRLTQPGLSLVKGMLLADEANNDIGFLSLSLMDARKKPLSEVQQNQPGLKQAISQHVSGYA